MRCHSRAVFALVLGLGVMVCGSSGWALAADDDAQPDAAGATAATTRTTTDVANDLLHQLTPTFDLTLASKFMFQALDYSNGASVAHPNFAVSHRRWTATAWANYQPNLGDVNRVELSLKYAQPIQLLTCSPGYKYVRSPNTQGIAPTHEVFVDLALQSALNPWVSFHQDVDQGEGMYASLGLSHTLTVPLTLGASAYYLNDYYGMTGLTAVQLTASTSFMWESLTISPAISRFVTPENGDFQDEAYIPGSWLFAVKVTPRL